MKRLFLATTMLSLGMTAAAYAETDLTILMLEGLDKAAMEAVAAQYTAGHPDVKITIQALPWSQFFQVSEMRMRAEDAEIDLIYTDAPVVATYAANGFIAPFADDIAAEARAKLVAPAVTAGTYDGKLYSLPMNSSAQVLFYNIDLLEAAGITPPDGLTPGATFSAADIARLGEDKRWTFEQVGEAARAVSGDEGGRTKPWGFAFGQFAELYVLQPLGGSLGSGIISDDAMSARDLLDGPAWTRAATWYSDLFNTWNASPRSLGFGEAPQMFVNGQLAMFVGGTWDVPAVADSKVNFGVAPYPRFAEGEAVTPTGSWMLSVTSASPDAAVAADFARYATLSEEGTNLWFANLNQLPTTLALLDKIDSDPAFDAFPADVMRLAAWESRNTAVPRPVTVAYSQLQDAFRTAFTDIANGVPVDEALATAVDAYDEAAARLNR
jgi:multiple sugar transport system substrate-binding protein